MMILDSGLLFVTDLLTSLETFERVCQKNRFCRRRIFSTGGWMSSTGGLEQPTRGKLFK